MLGLGEMLGGGIGIASGHPIPGIAVGFLKSAIDNPAIKSQLAIALRRASLPAAMLRTAPKRVLPAAARAATESLRSGRKTKIGSGELPDTFARGGRSENPLERLPDRAAILRSLLRPPPNDR